MRASTHIESMANTETPAPKYKVGDPYPVLFIGREYTGTVVGFDRARIGYRRVLVKFQTGSGKVRVFKYRLDPYPSYRDQATEQA
jgi:hypothetical protein